MLRIFVGNSGFVVGDREREALLKLPQRWKKQYAALLFPTLLGKVQDNFSTAPTTPTAAKLTESFWEGTFGTHARPSTLRTDIGNSLTVVRRTRGIADGESKWRGTRSSGS